MNDSCTLLPWDSEFWGLRVAKVNASTLHAADYSAVRAWCRHHDVRCLYFLADGEDEETLMTAFEHGFQFVDVRTDMERALPGNPSGHPSDVSYAQPEDLDELKRIARISHSSTRFFKDRRFPRESAQELYARWIVRDQEMGGLLVCREPDSGKPTGYLSVFPEKDSAARISLLAVDPDHRGMGIGRRLLNAAIIAMAPSHMVIRVATQGITPPVLRLYEGTGFRVREARIWYHKWFE